MKILSRNPLLQQSSEEIKNNVKQLLLAAGVKDKLPTPKEDIVACAKLVEVGEIELSEYEERWLKKGGIFLKNAFSKIKGLIDFRKKIIYVNPYIHNSKKTFVAYHEITHRILPWHEGLYNPHIETDYSIDPKVATGLEIEANLGASLIQFQVDRFSKELKDFPLGLGSAILLADKYKTSLHSTFRKYIEDNHKSCALLVLKTSNSGTHDNQKMFLLWYPLQSHKFTMKFGMLDWEKLYYPGHPIYNVVLSDSSKPLNTGEIVLRDLSGSKKKCRTEAFHNGFNYFVLIYPAPHLLSRKKVILADSCGYLS